MGDGSWSRSFWDTVNAAHAAAGTDPFAHTAAIHSGRARAATHKALDPKGVLMREARDSAEHPNSTPIAVLFDVTGSMGDIPVKLQEKLSGLLTLLVKKSYVEDPQIMFGGIGDAECDSAPLQIGQFESDNRMDECLTNIFLEGGGGGQKAESYDLGMYFMARHTSLDAVEKRGRKGYLFMIGDELCRPTVNRHYVQNLIGDKLEADVPIATIVEELKQKFEVYYIIPLAGSGHGRDPEIYREWSKLLGKDRVMRVEGIENVCEVIGLTIGLAEGTIDDLDDGLSDLDDLGASKTTKKSVSTALSTIVTGTAVKGRSAKASGAMTISGGGRGERI